MELEILFEDEAVTVCRKPAGVPTQSAKATVEDMVSLLKKHYVAEGKAPYVGLVHRLDQPVEGVMVYARTKEAAAKLSKQLTEGRMGKRYLAVTKGDWKESQGSLTDWLCQEERTNLTRVADQNAPGAKKAILEYQVKETVEGKSLVEIKLLTGRHHQIRVQMAHAGHSIVGDRKYGQQEEASEYEPLALCSTQISFRHPQTGKEMNFQIQPKGNLFQSFSLALV